MDKKFNIIYVTLSVLVAVVLVQSYIIYDFKDSLATKSEVQVASPSSTLSLNSYHPSSVDPFEQMKRVQEQMQKSFGQFNSAFANDPFFQDAFAHMGIAPLSDLHDDGDNYVIEIDIPGVSQQNINIKTEDGRISISANIDTSKDVDNANYIHKERFTQRFERSFMLPMDADEQNIKTNYENGVLKVIISKKS